MIASRVADELKKESDVEVVMIKGGLGEFSVSIDEQKVIDTNRLWYPTPTKVVKKLKTMLAK